MNRYIGGLIVSITAILVGVIGFAFAFYDALGNLITGAVEDNLTRQDILAVSIPFGILLPVIFGFIKAIDICLERINQHLRSKRMKELLEKIRIEKEEGTLYIIDEDDWQYVYEMQRDCLISISYTKPGWTASLKI